MHVQLIFFISTRHLIRLTFVSYKISFYMCGIRGTSVDWLSSYFNNIYQLCIMIASQNVK